MTHPTVASFLQTHPPQLEADVLWRWHGHDLALRVTDHLSELPPPLEWITSARCVVFWRGRILVVQDPYHFHILPGGRREPGESLRETAEREVLEETGWQVRDLCLVGFRHFHHLSSKPDTYPYLYPDFFQVIFTGQAVEFRPEAKEADGYELGSTMRPLTELHALKLTSGERFHLRASLQKNRQRGQTPRL